MPVGAAGVGSSEAGDPPEAVAGHPGAPGGVPSTRSRVHAFSVRQLLSDTWIGETGSGYWAKGIWMDDDLTKFFTKLFLPPGSRIYPHYPFVCRYKTVCRGVLDLSSGSRQRQLSHLDEALSFLEPHMSAIQESLRDRGFSEDMPLFEKLREGVPSCWREVFGDVHIRPYLNEAGMKEFALEELDA